MIYYIEVNTICIIFLLLLRFPSRNTDTTSSRQRILMMLIWTTVAFCLSDMIAGIFRGKLFPGAEVIIEFSNAMYFELLAVISYLWCIYVYARFPSNGVISRKTLVHLALPVIAFSLIALSNPITHILFTVTSDNLYQRNIGVYLHWIVVWGYFLIPSINALRLYLREPSILKKQEILPLLFFVIAPLLASIIQMVFYGTTTTQVGITVSLMMICLKSQDSQILTDALTGINNRHALESFMDNQLLHNKDAVYTLIMMDVNDFKRINDKYGHMTGDLALKKIASALKESCKTSSGRIHLSRFGGDEFILLGINCSKDEIELLINSFTAELEKIPLDPAIPCKINVSIGYAQGKCTQEKEFNELINQADQAMYKEKAKRHFVVQPKMPPTQ